MRLGVQSRFGRADPLSPPQPAAWDSTSPTWPARVRMSLLELGDRLVLAIDGDRQEVAARPAQSPRRSIGSVTRKRVLPLAHYLPGTHDGPRFPKLTHLTGD